MRAKLAYVSAFTMVLLVSASGNGRAGSVVVASSPPADVRKAVQTLVSGAIPGAILYVRQGDRSYAVTAGYADKAAGVPMRAGDTYAIGSTTKSYTAVLVMRLVAQGRIALGAPVSRYLPGVVPNGGRITIGELLSHTSGLYNYTDDAKFRAPYLAGDLRHVWTPRQLIGFAVAHPPLFPPGKRFSYSNTNYVLLGLIVERVTGETYARQLRENIFGLLGLAHTRLRTVNGRLPEVHGYLSFAPYGGPAGSPVIDGSVLSPSFAWSAGAIAANVEDVANFFRGLLSGKLVPHAQLTEMENTAATGGVYGLGLMPTNTTEYEVKTACGRAWGHGGSEPGYYNLPISSPDGSRQAVLMVNADAFLITKTQYEQMFKLVGSAYCDGVPS